MANLFQTLRGVESRADPGISLEDWISLFTFHGSAYPYGLNQTLAGSGEEITGGFTGLVQGAYKANGVVAACIFVRQRLFSEARFQFQQMEKGRPGKLFGNQELGVLEQPWPGGTTGDLLTRAITDADLAGNFFARRQGRDRVYRMRPDWVTIVLGSNRLDDDPALAWDAEVLGYLYHPRGRAKGLTPDTMIRSEVAHFAPIPDPTAVYRGMSWLTPVLREIQADSATTSHKDRFFTGGATPNMIITLDREIKREAAEQWATMFREQHEGAANAYKTLILGAGATANVVGSSFKEIDFKATQGAGETRIAAAAGVPPIIVGLSEGLEAATYSNYGQARRAFADGTMRPLWRNMAGSLSSILAVPAGARVWYDDRDIPFLQEDEKDAADIVQVQAGAMRTLVDGGFTPESVIQAVTAGDLALLVHTGLPTVQVQSNGAPPVVPAAAAEASVRDVLAELLART